LNKRNNTLRISKSQRIFGLLVIEDSKVPNFFTLVPAKEAFYLSEIQSIIVA